MRVLHLISSGGMYGAEAVILNLSHELNAQNPGTSRLGVFAHGAQSAPALHIAASRVALESELLPCNGQIDLGVLKRIRACVQRNSIDLVHAHGYKADIYAYLALRRGKDRPALVSTCHTWYDNDVAVRLYGIADRWTLRFFDEVVAVSEQVRQQLLQAGVYADRVHLIRNGVSLDTFSGIAKGRQQGSDEARDEVCVGLVGRLAPEKGVDLFLRAAAEILRQFPNTRFVVAGDGPDRGSLESLIDELGLRGRAALAGAQGDMARFYTSLDILVSASRQEGLPVALLEGMASGLPLVATTAGEVPQIVAECETGYLVAIEDPGALASAVCRLLADTALRRRLGSAGERRAAEHFSAGRMAREYTAVYAKALASQPAARTALARGAMR